MKYKKLLRSFLLGVLAAVFLPVSAWAQTLSLQVNYALETRNLEISGSLERGAYQAVTLLVLPAADPVSGLTEANLDPNANLVFAVKADSNGGFSASVTLPDTFETNEYKVYAFNGNLSASDSFIHLNAGIADQVLRQAAGKSQAEFGAFLYAHAQELGINTAAYFDNSAYINDCLYHFQPAGGYKNMEFTQRYYISYATCLYNKKELSLDGLLKDHGTKLQVSYAEYEAYSDKVKKKLDELLSALDFRRKDFTACYRENSVIAQLKAAGSYEELKTVMLANHQTIGIDTGDLDKLNTYYANRVFKTLFAAKNLNSLSDYASAFDKAVAEETKNQKKADSGSSNSPSRGGGGSPGLATSATPAPLPTQPPVTPAPEDPVKKNTFEDIEAHWCRAAVESLAEKGIIAGKTETIFAPEDSITRAEIAKLLVKALGIGEEQENAFEDVAADAWYGGVVNGAAKAGIIKGYEDGTFRPEQPVSRQDLCVLLYRALEAKGIILEGSHEFPDSGQIGDYAKTAVEAFGAKEIIKGDGTGFHPLDYATRGETAVILNTLVTGYLNQG